MSTEVDSKDIIETFNQNLDDPTPENDKWRAFSEELAQKYPEGIDAKAFALQLFQKYPVLRQRYAVTDIPELAKPVEGAADNSILSFLSTPLLESQRAKIGEFAESAAGLPRIYLGKSTAQQRTTDKRWDAGFYRGLSDTGIDMTSPTNLALLAGMAAVAPAKVLQKFPVMVKAAQTGAMAAFSGQSIFNAIHDAAQMSQSDDPYESGRLFAKSFTELLMGAQAGKAAVKGTAATLNTAAERLRAAQAAAAPPAAPAAPGPATAAAPPVTPPATPSLTAGPAAPSPTPVPTIPVVAAPVVAPPPPAPAATPKRRGRPAAASAPALPVTPPPGPVAPAPPIPPVTPVAPPSTGTAMLRGESWAMPRQQFLAVSDAEIPVLAQAMGVKGSVKPGTPKFEATKAQIQERLQQSHRFSVQRALSEGKAVPPEVLADYPDLVPAAPVVPIAPPVAPSAPPTPVAAAAPPPQTLSIPAAAPPPVVAPPPELVKPQARPNAVPPAPPVAAAPRTARKTKAQPATPAPPVPPPEVAAAAPGFAVGDIVRFPEPMGPLKMKTGKVVQVAGAEPGTVGIDIDGVGTVQYLPISLLQKLVIK